MYSFSLEIISFTNCFSSYLSLYDCLHIFFIEYDAHLNDRKKKLLHVRKRNSIFKNDKNYHEQEQSDEEQDTKIVSTTTQRNI